MVTFLRLETRPALLLAAVLAAFPAASAIAPSTEDPLGKLAQTLSGEGTAAAIEPETLTFQNRPIVDFRVPFIGVTPRLRVKAARSRIEAVVEEQGPLQVGIRDSPEGKLVTIDGGAVFCITPEDVDHLAGDTMERTAERAVKALSLALSEYEEMHSPARLLRDALRAAVATLLFVFLLWVSWRLRGRLTAWIQRALERGTKRVVLGGYSLLEPARVGVALKWVVNGITLVGSLAMAYLWLVFCLERFPYTRPWGEGLGGYLVDVLRQVAAGLVGAIPGLVFIAVIVLITRGLARAVGAFFRSVETGNVQIPWLHPETAAPTRWIVVTTLWLFALALSYPHLPGSQSLAFKGVSLFVGLMVSLGSTNLFNQVSSGLVLMYSRTLKNGEYVRIGEIEGTVLSLGVLSTKVRTIKNEEVTIPNAVVVTTLTRNFSRGRGDRGVLLYTSVTIGYSAPWRQVHALLLAAAERTEGLLRDPKPFVLQRSLSDFYVEYEISARIERPEMRIPVLDALHANIQDLFNEHGVQIMSPHYLGDTAVPVVVPKEKWYEPPATPPGSTR